MRSAGKMFWIVAFALSSAANADRISTPGVTLPASGEPASQNSPPCSDGYTKTTAQEVLPKVYKAFDEYVGFAVASTLSNFVPGFDAWMGERMGINNGPSVCATQCIAAPARALIEGCIADAEEGDKCKPAVNGDGPAGWAGMDDLSQAQQGDHVVTCVTFKNWSHDRNRVVRLRASW